MTVFISYSRESDEHVAWVRKLADALEELSDIHVIFDEYDLRPGHDLPAFMEKGLRCDLIVAVITPEYVRKAESRTGGVGYESSVIAADLLANQLNGKFVPALRSGSERPPFLKSKVYVDFRSDGQFSRSLGLLTSALRGIPAAPRPTKKHDSSATSAPEIETTRDEPSIVFTDNAGTDFDIHAFQFEALINGEQRWCIVAQETIRDHFNTAGGGHDAAWNAFVSNRSVVNAAAREAIRNVKVTPDGRIVIGSRELSSAAAANRIDGLYRHARKLVEEGKEISKRLGHPIEQFATPRDTSLDSLVQAVSTTHERLTTLRNNMGTTGDRVAWEQTRSDDDRTADEIVERLAGVETSFMSSGSDGHQLARRCDANASPRRPNASA